MAIGYSVRISKYNDRMSNDNDSMPKENDTISNYKDSMPKYKDRTKQTSYDGNRLIYNHGQTIIMHSDLMRQLWRSINIHDRDNSAFWMPDVLVILSRNDYSSSFCI